MRRLLAVPFLVVGGVAGFGSLVLYDIDRMTDEVVRRLVRE